MRSTRAAASYKPHESANLAEWWPRDDYGQPRLYAYLQVNMKGTDVTFKPPTAAMSHKIMDGKKVDFNDPHVKRHDTIDKGKGTNCKRACSLLSPSPTLSQS